MQFAGSGVRIADNIRAQCPTDVISVSNFDGRLHVVWPTARERQDSVQLPAPSQPVKSGISGTPTPAFAKRKFIYEPAGKNMREIESRDTFVSLEVVRILNITKRTIHIASEIDDFRVRIR